MVDGDRALIAVMVYSFARVGAVIGTPRYMDSSFGSRSSSSYGWEILFDGYRYDPDTGLYREGDPDGPIVGFHSGIKGEAYVDPDLARLLRGLIDFGFGAGHGLVRLGLERVELALQGSPPGGKLFLFGG